ncbi:MULTISPECIES: hypothetical protein, partial [unclassified Carboxylicivirga]|uniref:hypothetical protein n=1 Tax=Carboxylicivirga TaxID=1628153 RepID=UPI003D356289
GSQSVVFGFIFFLVFSQINDLAELNAVVNLRNRSNRLMRYGGLLGAAVYNFFQDALQKRAENLCIIQLFPL